MLTMSRLRRWNIDYYNRTADAARNAATDRQAANGGLGEYYSEADTRTPTWLLVGDIGEVARLTGLGVNAIVGESADTWIAARWLDDGIAPNGARGRAFRKDAVHGFDLTFAAPKSVSLMRALGDDVMEKVIAKAHRKAIEAAMAYLNEHAAYTRVYNKETGHAELQRLPGLAAIAYQHETSRCGDPHLHTHVVLSNRQPRSDGVLVSLDSKSLYHELKAAGTIYQAVLRHEVWLEAGLEWGTQDPHNGMAEIAGIDSGQIKVWSQRSTQLRQWAEGSLTIVDGEPTAAQLAAAQKATRPAKPESLSYEELREGWRADTRGLVLDASAQEEARTARRAAARTPLNRLRIAQMAAHIDKAAFTRADLVEVIGAQLPVDAFGEPRERIEALVDEAAIQISPDRAAHQREGSVSYTVEAVIAEEERILDLVDASDSAAYSYVDSAHLAHLAPDQQRAVTAIAESHNLVQLLQAPAGAGKTHSLSALRAIAGNGEVLVLAPTGKAVDEAMRDGAADRGLTIAKALNQVERGELRLSRKNLIVVDEAAMVGTPELEKVLSAAVGAAAKVVLVGDPYQLAPVRGRGGMFEQLCTELPWAQRLAEVRRMRDPEERHASLALRSARGNRLRKAIGWYRNQGRLHTGDQIAMAQDAVETYVATRIQGKDVAVVCDRWDMVDAINIHLHDVYAEAGAESVEAARDHHVCKGDLILTRRNDPTIQVTADPAWKGGEPDQVRNGNRWQVVAVNAQSGRIAAERIGDGARVIFERDYARENIVLGYATTVHAAQGMTVGTRERPGVCWAVLSENTTRSMAYVAATRATGENHLALYQPVTEEAIAEQSIHQPQRGSDREAVCALHRILSNDERPRTAHAEAEQTHQGHLPRMVVEALERNKTRRSTRAAIWREHLTRERHIAEMVEEGLRETWAREQSREHSRSRAQENDGYGWEL